MACPSILDGGYFLLAVPEVYRRLRRDRQLRRCLHSPAESFVLLLEIAGYRFRAAAGTADSA